MKIVYRHDEHASAPRIVLEVCVDLLRPRQPEEWSNCVGGGTKYRWHQILVVAALAQVGGRTVRETMHDLSMTRKRALRRRKEWRDLFPLIWQHQWINTVRLGCDLRRTGAELWRGRSHAVARDCEWLWFVANMVPDTTRWTEMKFYSNNPASIAEAARQELQDGMDQDANGPRR